MLCPSFTYCNAWLILGSDSGRVVSATVGVESAVVGRQCRVDGADGDWGNEMVLRQLALGVPSVVAIECSAIARAQSIWEVRARAYLCLLGGPIRRVPVSESSQPPSIQ